MIKSKRIISSIISLCLLAGIVPSYAIEKDNNTLENRIEHKIENKLETYSTHIGNSGLADTTTIPPTKMPTITLDGAIAYCMDVNKEYPENITYTLGTNYDSNSKLLGLAYYGYPNNATGLMAKHGVTAAQARSFTQYAIYEITNPGFFANRSFPYLDAIKNAANSGIPSVSMGLNPSSSTATVNGNVQVSPTINTSSSYTGTFTFPSDANVYSTDINGVKNNTFNIGSSFKIEANDTVSGAVTRNITVNITQPTLTRYIPSNSAYQDLGKPSTKTTTITVPVTVTFPGVVKLGDILVRKVDDGGAALSGVEFGLYSDSAATNLISKKTTDDSGNVSFTGLNVGTTYYIKELTPLPGYVVDNSIKPVTVSTTPTTITVTNTKINGTIKIVKTEEGNANVKLSGAEFEIRNSSDAVVDNLTTNENGEAVSKSLPFGQYKVKETKAPNGYLLGNRIIDVNITENQKQYLVSYENTPIMGKIQIFKKDVEDLTPLKGVKFGVYKASDNSLVQELVTGDDGKAITNNLRIGDYYVKEIQALPGYITDGSKYPVSITENGKVYLVEVTNQKIKGKIKIVKKDAESESPMKGVKFGIFKKSDNSLVEELITGEDGTVTSKELLYGEYYIQEIEAPEGYVYDDTKYDIFVSEHERIYTKDVTNRKIKGKIEVVKKAFEKETPLQGVKFGIFTTVDDTIVEEIITNEEGKAITKDLVYGEYYIKELETIEGYVLGEEIYPISIKENEKVYVQEVFNKLIEGDLIFKKVDMDTKEIVAGATIEIKGIGDLNSDILVTFESTLEGDRMTLPYGPYEAVEISAPHNYVKSEEVLNFEIKENGQVVELELENVKKKGMLKIIKKDEDTEKVLQGATFGLYDKDKNLIAEGKTNEEGVVTFEGIVCDTYYYGEMVAPDGYKLDLDLYEFTLEENGEVVEKIAYNKLLPPMPDTGDECPGKLPNTSGNNIIFMVMSLVMLSFGMVLILNKRRIRQ